MEHCECERGYQEQQVCSAARAEVVEFGKGEGNCRDLGRCYGGFDGWWKCTGDSGGVDGDAAGTGTGTGIGAGGTEVGEWA